MSDSPREAIRRKKHSSMRIAVDLVHAGRADAMVSAGNTGALTAISHFVLKCLPQVERAPIMSAVPNARGFTHMLDLGANTRATPVQLEQFAVMGAVVARDVHGTVSPRVGLLNIGEEEMKGHETIQEAHAACALACAAREGGPRVPVPRLRRGPRHLHGRRRRRRHRRLHRQRRAQDDGRPREPGRRPPARRVHRRPAEQDRRPGRAPGAAPGRRHARFAPLQRRRHGRAQGSRGKKPWPGRHAWPWLAPSRSPRWPPNTASRSTSRRHSTPRPRLRRGRQREVTT